MSKYLWLLIFLRCIDLSSVTGMEMNWGQQYYVPDQGAVLGEVVGVEESEHRGCPLWDDLRLWYQKKCTEMRYQDLLYAHRCECYYADIERVVRDADACGITAALLLRKHNESGATLLEQCILSNECRHLNQCKRDQVAMLIQAAFRAGVLPQLLCTVGKRGNTVFNAALYAECWFTFLLLLNAAAQQGVLAPLMYQSMNGACCNYFMKFMTVDWRSVTTSRDEIVQKVLNILCNGLDTSTFELYKTAFLRYAQHIDNGVDPSVIEALKNFEA